MIRELRNCQTFDPARGSFMVNPIPVKSTRGKPKTKFCSDGRSRPVYRAGNHIIHTAKGVSHQPHPEAFDFVQMD